MLYGIFTITGVIVLNESTVKRKVIQAPLIQNKHTQNNFLNFHCSTFFGVDQEPRTHNNTKRIIKNASLHLIKFITHE